MEDFLGHPLVVLAIGAVLTGLLIPQFTQRWQDQRKALEIKADLIERVSCGVAEIFTATQLASVGAASQPQDKFDEAYRSWAQERVVLTSLIRAYFSSDHLDRAWLRCRASTTAYYVQSGIQRDDPDQSARARSSYLRIVGAGLESDPPEDFSEEAFSRIESPNPGRVEIEDVFRLRAEVWRSLDITVAAIRRGRIRF